MKTRRLLVAVLALTACSDSAGVETPSIEIDISPAVVTGTELVNFRVRNTGDIPAFLDACGFELILASTQSVVTTQPCILPSPGPYTRLEAGESHSSSFKMETRFPRGLYRVRIRLLKGPTPSDVIARPASPAFELR